ncbi:MAG: hypothetical protein PHI12_06555 [Dehalococcoidales bacterium]|nr:hypothetical protein [Dehalococcoidales bacterium]
MTDEKTKQAEEQARAQLESIMTMVKRLQHCDDCDGGEDCELTDQEIFHGINTYYKEGMTASEDDKQEYHDRDNAAEKIQEDPLEVRSDWHTPGDDDFNKPAEYKILLCTGGPACRIVGDLDEHGQPDRARIEYQDWFTPWIELVDITSEERDALLAYAQQFYFGE